MSLFVDVGGSFIPVADIAQTELRTSDVGRHEVLLGPYSRDGWNHPGPLLFYALAVPYRLLGERAIALSLGALLINAASIIGIAVIARRRGAWPLLAVTLLGCALVLHAIGPEFVRNPWNPYVVVLPFTLVLFLTWEMLCGGRWALPVAVGVASFCTQTHVGYALLILPLVGAGAVALGVRAVRDGSMRRLLRTIGWASAVLVALWLPPIIEQLKSGQGNLREILDYFGSAPADHTWGEGARAVYSQLALAPEWVTGRREVLHLVGEPRFLSHPPVPLLVAPIVVVVLLLARRRHGDGLRLAAVVAGAMVLGAASVARTTGPALDYRLRWNSWLGMTAVVLAAWGAWELLAPRTQRRWGRAASTGVIGVIVALTAASTVNAATAGVPYAHESAVAQRVLPGLESSLPGGPGFVVVGQEDGGGGAYVPSVIRHLERAGVPVRVDSGADIYGAHRVVEPDEVVRARLVVVGDDFDGARQRPDLRLLSYWGTISLRERDRRAAAVRDLKAEFDAGRIDQEELFRATQAVDIGSAVGIFLERPT